MKETPIVIDDIQALPMSPAQEEDAALQLERDFVQEFREAFAFSELIASTIAQAAVRCLRREYGGSDLWIPAPSKHARNEAIRREFDGRNLAEVMQRHGVSRATVYRAVGEKSLISPLSMRQEAA